MSFANCDVLSNIKYHEKDYEICNFEKNVYSCNGFLLEDQSVSRALQSLKHQFSNCETNDSYSRHECLEDPLCDPEDALVSLNHEIYNCETNEKSSKHDFLENLLCVPRDPIESVEWMNSLEFDSLDFESFFPNSPDISEKKRRKLQKVKRDETKDNPLCDISSAKINHPKKKSSRNKKPKLRRARGRSLKNKKKKVTNRSNAKKDERRCSHCEARETPQWRIGPEGPNTLCNACGMRYKVGKLFQEYKPAASPIFDVTKHSNVHKKILKIGRYDKI